MSGGDICGNDPYSHPIVADEGKRFERLLAKTQLEKIDFIESELKFGGIRGVTEVESRMIDSKQRLHKIDASILRASLRT